MRRSAVALDLLVDDETGATAAAATMGLPERIGGARNVDYRYAWLRDTNLALNAELGFRPDPPRTGVDARRDAEDAPAPAADVPARRRPELPSRQLALDGYRGSRPVVLGDSARSELQLGNFGDVLAMARAKVARYVYDHCWSEAQRSYAARRATTASMPACCSRRAEPSSPATRFA